MPQPVTPARQGRAPGRLPHLEVTVTLKATLTAATLWSLTACAPPGQLAVEVIDGLTLPQDAQAVWRLDPEGAHDLRFQGRGLLGVPAEGVWQRYAVQVVEPSDDPETWSIEVLIDMASVTAQPERLQTHLKTADFFDVNGYPEARFSSRSLTPLSAGGGDPFEVTGDLTVRGTSATVRWDTDLRRAGDRLHTTGSIPLSRWTFGLYADDIQEPGGDRADDEVLFSYDVTLSRIRLDP